MFATVSILPLLLAGGAVAYDEPVVFETAVVRARPIDRATASVTVIEREEIEALNVQSVAELMRFVPGLDVVAAGGRGGLAASQMRGGDPNFTVVMVDGVPLNDTTDQLGGAVNLNSLPLAHVERIEIIRGPQSSFLGTAGLSGVVNVITRQGDAPKTRSRLELGVGDESSASAAASFSNGGERGSYFVGLSWEEEDRNVGEDSFSQLNLVGDGELRRRSGEYRFNARFTSWSTDDYPEGSGGPALGPVSATRDSDHDEGSLGLDALVGSDARPHRFGLTLYRHELDRRSPGAGTTVPPSVERTEYFNMHLRWSWPLIENERDRLSLGAHVNHEDGQNTSTLFTVFGDLDGSYELDRTTPGLLAEWVSARGRLVYEVTLRVDRPQEFDSEVSPRAGLTYRFGNDATTLRASMGRGFKLPSFYALGSPVALGGNPDLAPEVSVGGDVELAHTFGAARARASLAGFHYTFEDLITFVFPPEGFGLVNRDEVDSTGGELSIDWRPTQTLSLGANATYQDVEDKATGEPLRQRPEWVGGLRFGWRIHPRLLWSVDGQWVSMSLDQSVAPAAAGRVSTAGYQLYGSAMRVELGPSWEAHLRVDNGADKSYETFIGFPGPGVRLRFGLRYRIH